MTLRTPVLTIALATLFSMPTVGAQAPQTPPTTAKAPDTASVAGKWSISLETPQGAIEVGAALKLDGKKIGGSLTGPTGEETPATGEVADGKITFSISPEGNTFTFVGAMKDADHMSGSLSSPMGEIPWTATRIKG